MPDRSFAIPSHVWTRQFDATLESAGRPDIYHHGIIAADQISLFVQRSGQAAQYRTDLAKGQAAYQSRLWNGHLTQ